MNKILFACVFVTLAVCVCAKPQWKELEGYNFELYVKDFGKDYSTSEYATRRQIFENRLKTILAHNKQNSSYKMGVNHLTDRTDVERNALLGYKTTNPRIGEKFVSTMDAAMLKLPPSIDWRTNGVVSPVKDQGQCGSCWTFATASTIESAYAQMTGNLPILSEQQILDCIPNPDQCGGTGGCGGGTADIAIAGLMSLGGLTSEWMYPYISYWGEDFKCQFNISKTKPVAILKGIAKIPSNNYNAVLSQLQYNTLTINVAASSWHDYETGVYTGCNNTTLDINHVVQLVGYGTDDKFGDYWLVRNSWTPSWGESGYIRLARTSAEECGIDNNPMDGTGCQGGPSQVTACGPCGLLYDASYPLLTKN